MPRHRTLRKLGVHRAACFALYRALLRQKHKLQLDQEQQRLFSKPIQAVFKRNAKLQSPPQISTALLLGYETLEGLCNGVTQPRILDRIFELAIPSRPIVQPRDDPSSPQNKNARAHKTRQRDLAPYPGIARTLARPFQKLSGRRHVPVLVNANKFPFLRIKKPQPPSLSRMIRDTAKTRERRLLREDRLASECSIAQDEDEWDQLLYERFDLDYGQRDEQPWKHEVKLASSTNHKQQANAIQKRIDISAKMYAIVEQEKALAEEEKDEKKKARRARWLARKGLDEIEIQETLYPQPEKTIRKLEVYPPLGETLRKVVPEQGHKEVQQPDKGQVSRKRGEGFKSRDEIQQLQEASLLPRTDEEIAKIKEARIRRKEEVRERKAQKPKRRKGGVDLSPRETFRKVRDTFRKLVPIQGYEKMNRPDITQLSRKIGEGFKSRDEIQQLHEASLLPRTDEEIAKIKEARIRRNEEERERKAQKPNRRKVDVDPPPRETFRKVVLKQGHGEVQQSDMGQDPNWAQARHRDGESSTNNQPQSNISRLQEELQRASSLVSDTRSRADQTDDQDQGIFRPSLFSEQAKDPQERDQC